MNRIHFESIDSTNTYLKNNYQNLDNYTFVSSNLQTQGRGRTNRVWDSEDNNLLFSLLIKDNRYYSKVNAISILTAYSIIEILSTYKINNLSIKWPNDIYAGENKICGILLESVSKENLECLIIGVGINVNQTEFVNEYIHEATSMKLQLNKDINIDELKDKVYEKLISNLEKLATGYDYYDEIIKYDYLSGKDVYALINNEKKLVRVKQINKDYSLCVDLNNQEYDLYSGEISFHI